MENNKQLEQASANHAEWYYKHFDEGIADAIKFAFEAGWEDCKSQSSTELQSLKEALKEYSLALPVLISMCKKEKLTLAAEKAQQMLDGCNKLLSKHNIK